MLYKNYFEAGLLVKLNDAELMQYLRLVGWGPLIK